MRGIWNLFLLSLLLTACNGATLSPVAVGIARSDLPRELAPQLAETDFAGLVTGNTAFALDLYHQLRAGDGNLFYSPHSISTALAMTYAGARSETAAQMAKTLHFTLNDAALHRAFNALDLQLATQNGTQEGNFELHIANSLWAEQDYTLLPDFLDLLAQNYGAGLQLVDFKTAAEAARQAINRWVAEQTADRIRDLIPEGGVDDLTRLVLANAIYFNAGWVYPFEAYLTRDGEFTPLSGVPVSVPLMRWSGSNSIGYTRGEGYQALELPYQGSNASMVLLVPDAGAFADFEASLSGESLARTIAQLKRHDVLLTMPKFQVDADFKLADALQALGMPLAFDPVNADFSAMDGTRDLYIGNVFHQAFVKVDEAGTEAAAATAVVVRVESMPAEELAVTIDRPFIFLIRDTQTGVILFLGRVTNPE